MCVCKNHIYTLYSRQSTFQYMIEAGGDKRWGGIFEGEIRDGLIGCKPSKKRPKLLKKFDGWNETKSSLVASNPYMPSGEEAYLTTAREVTRKVYKKLSIIALLLLHCACVEQGFSAGDPSVVIRGLV